MSDDLAFKRFLAETKAKAVNIIGQDHVTLEAREILKDFIEISNQIDKLKEARADGQADQRVLQKRYEQLKGEHRDAQKKIERITASVSTEILPLIKGITAEANLVGEKATIHPELQLAESANRLKDAVKKLVTALVKL